MSYNKSALASTFILSHHSGEGSLPTPKQANNQKSEITNYSITFQHPMNFYAIASLLDLIVVIIVGIVLIIKRDKAKSIRYFSIFNFFVIGWAIGYFFWQISKDYNSAMIGVKILMFSAIWGAPAFFHFTLSVAEKESQLITPVIVAYLMAIPFTFLNFTSPIFIAGLQTKLGISFFPTGGDLFFIFVLQWLWWFGWGFVELFKAWKSSYEPEKKQFLGSFTLATLISIFAGSFNYFLWFDIPIPPITTMIVSVYGITITLMLLSKKNSNLSLFYFFIIAGIILIVSLAQFMVGYYLNMKSTQWLAITIILISILIVGLLYKKNKQKSHV